MRSVKVAAIVLAAGASTRLGRPKQHLLLGGETLLSRALRVAAEAGLAPVIAVVRPGVTFHHEGRDCIVVVNPAPDEGMSASIRSGLLALPGVTGAVVMTCDQVLLRPQHLQALCAVATRVTGSLYSGRVGVPAYFPATVFEQLMQLTGDTGARHLLRGAATVNDESLALDIDTEEDLQRAQAQVSHLRTSVMVSTPQAPAQPPKSNKANH